MMIVIVVTNTQVIECYQVRLLVMLELMGNSFLPLPIFWNNKKYLNDFTLNFLFQIMLEYYNY